MGNSATFVKKIANYHASQSIMRYDDKKYMTRDKDRL